MSAVREIFEQSTQADAVGARGRTVHNVWRCRGCGQLIAPVELDGNPVLFGPCECAGWTADERPELVQAVDAFRKLTQKSVSP